jgi:hypothetical protein
MFDESQGTAMLTVKIAQQNPTTVTRSVTETIRNINILIFDAQGHLIGSAYADSEPTSVSVPVRVSSSYTICAIANTGSSTYFDGISTLTELKAKTTTAVTNPTAIADIMYGEMSITSNMTSPTVYVQRLYSKYTFTITPNSDIAITGYQLFNVPNECYITSGHTANPTTDFTGLNYSAVATPITAGTAVTTEPYYIYENLAGTNADATTAELRNINHVPSSGNASYLLVTAKGVGYNAGWASTYRVYLGGVTNATNPVVDYTNFNINRNFDYKCNIAIAGSGVNDVRVSYSPTTSSRSNVYFGDATIGDYLYSDGTWGTVTSGKSIVGIIFSDELTQAQYNAGCRHGKAIALKNAYSSICTWGSGSPYTSQTVHPYCQNLKTCFNDVSSGYDAPSSFATSSNPAWYYCNIYKDGTTHSGSLTGRNWYLPSMGEWWDVMENLGTWTDAQKTTIKGMRTSTTPLSTDIIIFPSENTTYYSDLNIKLKAINGDTITPSSGVYNFWSASEYDITNAAHLYFLSSSVRLNYDIKGGGCYARSVLAF